MFIPTSDPKSDPRVTELLEDLSSLRPREVFLAFIFSVIALWLNDFSFPSNLVLALLFLVSFLSFLTLYVVLDIMHFPPIRKTGK